MKPEKPDQEFIKLTREELQSLPDRLQHKFFKVYVNGIHEESGMTELMDEDSSYRTCTLIPALDWVCNPTASRGL